MLEINESGIKKILRQLEGLHVDFCKKFQICPLSLKLGLMGFIDMGRRISKWKIRTMYSWGSMPLFKKNTSLSHKLEMGYVWVLRRQEHGYGHKNFPQYNIKVYGSVFRKKKSSLTLKLGVSGFKDARNTNMIMKNLIWSLGLWI